MKRQVRWLLERANISQAGHGVALVKDALREINMEIETHSRNEKIDITENKRYYEIPEKPVKVLDIKVKNHMNSKDEYRTIPRMIYKPVIEDADNDGDDI